MKKISLLLFFYLFITGTAYTQNLEVGKTLYQNGDYERSARYFDQISTPEAQLYSGKSYYSLGKLLKAKHYLNLAAQHKNLVETYMEAQYTLAIVNFQLKDFTASLNDLFVLKEAKVNSLFKNRADVLYKQILAYLSLSQLNEVFKRTTSASIKLDLLNSSLGRFHFTEVKTILNKFENTVVDYKQDDLYQIKEVLRDSVTYRQRFGVLQPSKAPNGILYKLGVALPHFDYDSNEYEISQHLYFGIQLAVEDFNSSHSNKKVFLKYRDTNTNLSTPNEVFNQLVWEDEVDAIIGPLFSEEAMVFSKLSQEYAIPTVTPLANSMLLSGDSNYLFQLNPTFAVHGKKMAQYAVKTLSLDTLAVLAEKNTPGEAAAYAFQNEAQKLGAVIQHFFVEDFEAKGYSILEYTSMFSKTDTANVADGLKAIYAPFTGAVSNSLIQSLLTDLEATRSDYVILGSEEWKGTDLSDRRLPATSIYYSQSFNTSNIIAPNLDSFLTSFKIRFQTEPNQFAYIGYDTANLILKVLSEVQNPDYLKEGLRNLTLFNGLSTKVSFSGHHVNQIIDINSITN